jgi:Fe2+ or Zn2+ uptake regulation protein
MSRRPVDQIASSRDAEGRQVIWEAIRAQGDAEFRVHDVTAATWISRHTVRSYINCLTAGGILDRRETDDGYRWRLARDEGFYAPRLNRAGQPVHQGLGVEQMWRTMRRLKEFTVDDLKLYASTDEVAVTLATVRDYCKMLLACGFLTCIQKANADRRATYRLTRNSGPLAPQIQRVKRVFAPNSKTVYRKGEA